MATLAERIEAKETLLAAYRAAELRIITTAQSFSVSNRSTEFASLSDIQLQIQRLEADLVMLRNGNRLQMQRVVPVDHA